MTDHIELLQDKVAEKNGSILGNVEPKGKRKKDNYYNFKCSEGHTFKSSWEKVIFLDSWCRKCDSSMKQITLEQVQELVGYKGGTLVSDEYVSMRKDLNIICGLGHTYYGTLDSISSGSWCQKCPRSVTLESIKELIGDRGTLLTKKYVPGEKLHIRCDCDYEWVPDYLSLHKGCWCPKCAGVAPLTLEDLHKIAADNNGKLISTECLGSLKHHIWECKEGHQWPTKPNTIKYSHTWCPICAGYKSEELTRKMLQHMVEYEFVKIRPDWLLGLELDGYCEFWNAAFEYQGWQHYRYTPFFHRNGPEDLVKQQKRDRQKYETCTRRGVKLIIVPPHLNHKTPEDLKTFLIAQLVDKQIMFFEE